MWFISVLLLSFDSCMALRTSQVATLVSEGTEKYTVNLALTLTDPRAKSGRWIEIAVDGVRRLSKTYPTQEGEPIKLHHITKGSVVTAHVGTYGACAYWVTPGIKHCTVGEWELVFTTNDENEQGFVPEALYEAYVKVAGWGPTVTIEVDHVIMYTFDSVFTNETFFYSGLKKGDLVRTVSNLTGDTCMYRVGNKQTLCHLDETWGLSLGSVMEFGETDDDEGPPFMDIKHYTVEFALERDDAAARKLEVGLNGHKVASKMSATEPGKAIIVHHVKGGSVFTAVAHDREEACCVYVGAGTGTQAVPCVGWTLNVNIQEESDKSFVNETFDIGYSVQRASTPSTKAWGLMVDGDWQTFSTEPRFFSNTLGGGWLKGAKVVPFVNWVQDTNCAHVVGEKKTKCEYNGWIFEIWTQLNMNKGWDAANWDWDSTDTGTDVYVDHDTTKIRVVATDRTTSSISTLECIARQQLEYKTAESGDAEIKIDANTQLFETKILTDTSDTGVKSATFIGQFPTWMLTDGFYCTVYKEESVMCEADTDGGSWTNDFGFTLEIDKD